MRKLIFGLMALILALGVSLPAALPASAQSPSIALLKEADVASTVEGGTINYSYTVTNTGDTALYDVTLMDNGVPVPLSGLTDEDGDTLLDDLASLAVASGNSNYLVPLGTAALSVDNTAIASGWYEGQEYTDDASLSIPIERNAAIELTKLGPASVGYFESVQADYLYTVENTGNASLIIVLKDDQTEEIVGPEGDDGNGLLDPGESWEYTSSYLIECTGIEEMEHINIATASGTTATGASTDNVTAQWTVTIFQWLPRTLGYWGNWDNHWTEECMADLVGRVNEQSAYFEDLTPEMVAGLLLGPDQKGKMTVEKAQTLLIKQLLTAWLNIKSYEGAIDADDTTCGSLDASLRPGAIIYVDGTPMTVEELIQDIESYLALPAGDQDPQGLLTAKDLLDAINNAGDNGYESFMP